MLNCWTDIAVMNNTPLNELNKTVINVCDCTFKIKYLCLIYPYFLLNILMQWTSGSIILMLKAKKNADVQFSH